MWSQLTIGWQWSARPRRARDAPPPPFATATPRRSRCWRCSSSPSWPRSRCSPPSARRIARRRAGRGCSGRRRSSSRASAIVFAGGRHFENGWLGTGGHGASSPAGWPRSIWATSLSVSSYWAHPGCARRPARRRACLDGASARSSRRSAVASAAILVRRVRPLAPGRWRSRPACRRRLLGHASRWPPARAGWLPAAGSPGQRAAGAGPVPLGPDRRRGRRGLALALDHRAAGLALAAAAQAARLAVRACDGRAPDGTRVPAALPRLRSGRGGGRGGRRPRRRRADQPRRPAGQGRARRDRRCVLGRRARPGALRPARPAGVRHVLLAGQEPRRRLHDRLPARAPAGREAAAGDHAPRLRRQPRQRAVRPVAGPGAGAPGRRRAAAPDGPGDGRRRHRVLEPAPGRQPAGDAHRRADPAVPAPRPGRPAAASASWASRWAGTAPCCWRRSART